TIVTYIVTFVTSMSTPSPAQVTQALFGQTRRGVLALLYGNPEKSFYLRQIARESGAGLGPVQRELAQLVNAGVIRRVPRGNQVYFSANSESPIFGELHSLVVKTFGISDVVRSALAPFTRQGRLEVALIFGSIASGTPKATSDVDLLLVGDLKLADILPVLRKLQHQLDREINPTIFTRSELSDRLNKKSHFLMTVLERPRIMLFGSEDDLRKLARKPVAHRAQD
ncbi:MAG: nucleotidyltransferase domain-containing protein, partial [Gemmatimonadales bacterium]